VSESPTTIRPLGAPASGARASEHPNARLMKRIWGAVSSGDREALERLVSDDVAWYVSGRNRWSGVNKGRDAVLGFLADMGSAAEVLNFDLEELLANDARVVALTRLTGRRGGKTLEMRYLVSYRFRNGQLCEGRSFPFDQFAVDEFWK
jgi:ketosteroid isomerase-like protein